MEELQESDVMWPGNVDAIACNPPIGSANETAIRKVMARARSLPSSPMDIATARRRTTTCRERDSGDGDGDGDGDVEEEEWAPPHVLAASRRRAEGRMAFSLCSGQGRTLKGRDLRHVRDSILRMTGFLEG